MPSQSYQLWLLDRLPSLDEIELAHASVGGTGPGRRFATQQINQAYAVLLSAQFQAFCRDEAARSDIAVELGVSPWLEAYK